MKLAATIFFFVIFSVLVSLTTAQICSTNDDCISCLQDSACGWCESTSECLSGNVAGPGGVAGNCTEWFYETCRSLPCETHTGCLACVRDPFCGWCTTTGVCREGIESGPVFSPTCADWEFLEADCTATAPPPPPPTTPPPPPSRRPPPPTRSVHRRPPPPTRRSRSARRPPPAKKSKSRRASRSRAHRRPPPPRRSRVHRRPPPPRKSRSARRPPPPSKSRTPSNSLFRSISAGSSVSPASMFIGLTIAVVAAANLL